MRQLFCHRMYISTFCFFAISLLNNNNQSTLKSFIKTIITTVTTITTTDTAVTVTGRGMAPTPPFFFLAVLAVLFTALSTASGKDSNVDYTGAVHPPSSTPTALC